MKNIKIFILAFVAVVILNACSPAEGNFAGSEYMPDMAHSVAYEANVYTYYYYNTWDEASTFKLKELSNPRLPVNGTVPRGYAGVYFASTGMSQELMMEHLKGRTSVNEISVPVNGNVPYYYPNTDEGRAQATAEIIENPFPITAAGLERGKDLYVTLCGICHGEKGNGLGYLYNEDENPNAKYPLLPANLISDDFVNSSNGRYYHAIMFGRNAMGSYADKLSYEERWQVIHYIRSLQAKEKKLAYDEKNNTLNPAYGTPASLFMAMAAPDEAPQPAEAGSGEAATQQQGGENHGGGNH